MHDLPPDIAAGALPVRLTATVTFYQPGEKNLFIADKSGAVFILVDKPYPFPIHAGDRVQVDGQTQASFRSIIHAGASVRILSHGAEVAARPAVYRQLISGELDCLRVTIQGRVRAASIEHHDTDTVAQLRVMTPGGIVQVYVQQYGGLQLDTLMDAEIQVTGIAGADFNEPLQLMRPKLFAVDARDVRILKLPRVAPLALPLTDIRSVMQSRFQLDHSKRVRVRGIVTAFEPGNFVAIEHDGQNLVALTRQTDPISIGSGVDVVGFADGHAYSAVLEDAQFYPTGLHEEAKPHPVSYADGMSGAYSDALVRMRGRVVSELRGEFADSMVILADRHPVTLAMQRKGRAPLPQLEPGSLVEVTGICRVTPSAWGKPLLFRLDLRNAGDLRVLARPPWWTPERLQQAGAGLLAITLLVLAWAGVLRGRVAAQTDQIARAIQIERERSRILEQVNSAMPLEALLEDICSSIAALVPGVRCTYVLHEHADHDQPDRQRVPAAPASFESALVDAEGRRLGTFRVQLPLERVLSPEQQATLSIGSSLMKLAVSQRRLYQDLNWRCTHDQLTELPNRRLADSRLEEALRHAALNGTSIGVAYIDVDRFKDVNDRHGHKTGDLYLQQVGKRLSSAHRASDLLARIGGDEFLLIATAWKAPSDAEQCVNRLLGCFADPFVLEGVHIRGSASIGLAIYPDHGDTPEALKRHADAAMYAMKHRGTIHEQERPIGASSTASSAGPLPIAIPAAIFSHEAALQTLDPVSAG